MQSKIAHAAERKAFSLLIDQVLKAGTADDREEKIDQVIEGASKLLKDTAPGVIRGLKAGLYPGSKWEQYLFNILDTIDHKMIKTMLLNGGYEAAFRGLRTCTEMAEKYQCNIPWIILFDPTSACNMRCKGCWAAEYGYNNNLSFEDMDSLVTQAKELGCHLFFLTGGEPLVRKDDIIKLAKKHDDCAFNIFTNATLIDQKFCDDVLDCANITFSISIEGTEETNDARRGEGDYQKVMQAFDLLRENKIFFGTSICYTSQNYKAVTDDAFLDMLVEKGAKFNWYFHYMPVGAGANADLMPTPEQREYMLHRIREIRGFQGGKPLFTMDFQNDGEYVGGCIAGGRVYCHINARGDVEPCVFIHYSNVNIHEHSLLECFQQPLFQEYRKRWPWNDNQLQPCPMLENPEMLPDMVKASQAHPTDYVDPESPEELYKRTKPYADAWKSTAERIWLEEHPSGKKIYDDEISATGVDKKAKIIAQADSEHENALEVNN